VRLFGSSGCGRLRLRSAWSLTRTVRRNIGRERIRRQFYRVVPILRNDVDVLIHPIDTQAPLLRQIRASRKAHILYCCGDASRSGFGWCIDFGGEVRYELGEWCDQIQEASSNYRELGNLVNAMFRAAQEVR
jgi:hypothetical protein